ncbi:MAG: hypothetical protein K2M27_07965 [Muribaculaceae bacterium]|nr:hypothetical protein [Muribaculaceae bacterium]
MKYIDIDSHSGKQSYSPFFRNKGAIFAGVALSLMLTPLLQSCGDSKGYRTYLDKYVELESVENMKAHAMKPGVSVYVDFSDGMNAAYGTSTSRDALRSLINVFTGTDNQASFFSLANDQITALDLPQTEVYNAIMSGKNYTKPKAPIEKTLKEILDKRQAAILITDFEEYNGAVIQQQNYAKDYFIKWLSSGYNIIFYKLDYKEGSKPKHLYFTVFDSPYDELAKKVETALKQYSAQGLEKFVIGGSSCQFAVSTSYPSSTQGGNYHNSNGEDLVSAVLEDGKEEAYKAYTLSPYDPFTEYYPFGETWENILSNISATREEGAPVADRYAHLISNVYVNFTLQDGYDIKGVEARAVNFDPAMGQIIVVNDSLTAEGKEFALPTSLPGGREVLDMFKASMAPAQNTTLSGTGWSEISLDFDTRFNGSVPASMSEPTDLLKVDIVISDATPRLDGIDQFFAWPGNNSLAESVRNTLNSEKVNPKGRAIITYYLKVL